MTPEATTLMNEALRVVKLNQSFSPAQVGAGVGLKKWQAETAARALSNAGVLELGFDCSAEFSPAFRKMREAANPAPTKAKAKAKAKAPRRKKVVATA